MRKFLLVVLVLLVVGLVAADRIGVRVAQNEIGKQVAAQYDLAKRPDVTIHGVPFLTQAVQGEYDQIDVRIGDWTQQGITVQDVKVEMRGVDAPLDQVAGGNADSVTARTATASAVLPFDLIKSRAPKEVKAVRAKDGNLEVDMSGQVLAFSLNGTAELSVKPSRRGIAITPVKVSTSGITVPLDTVRDRLAWYIPITDLPVGSRISQIHVTGEGVEVAATAENVKLGQLQKMTQ
ncbi:DUF2993 domain-containing protein [Actinomadura logoneensis]|uniref:DUF2993 domain-containing protein n=1 Tax=Actinomadura logoneensis TaxID=2293572 RepID=A0A372JUE9_9ACTN|nr:DUF2993 domain-containing protein [Actinomadura logoneensis]RFU43354.1 DUF2993 domain-containing protein [Actinomadura logoneensis]